MTRQAPAPRVIRDFIPEPSPERDRIIRAALALLPITDTVRKGVQQTGNRVG